MSDCEAKIKTKFGELTIHFTDKTDLESKLSYVQDFEFEESVKKRLTLWEADRFNDDRITVATQELQILGDE